MKTITASVVLVFAFVSSSFAMAGQFAKKHPRRAEVVNRADKQIDKNNQAAVNGKLTDKQAQRLDHQDRRIKREEQRQAHQNGGHITKDQQARDNRQENHINQERNNMEKRDAAAPAPTGTPGN